jgi:rubredoxin
MTPNIRLRLSGLLDPVLALLDYFRSPAYNARGSMPFVDSTTTRPCPECEVDDYPRVDRRNRHISCRHCGYEYRWWL